MLSFNKLKLTDLFMIVLLLLIVVSCGKIQSKGETSTTAPLSAELLNKARGFGCTVEFIRSTVIENEEFIISVIPSGDFASAPTSAGTPTFVTFVSSTSQNNILKITARAKYSFVFTARVSDKRGRQTRCSAGLTVQNQ